MTDENQLLLQRFAKAGFAEALAPVFAAVERGDATAARAALVGTELSGNLGRRVALAFKIALRSIERLKETGAVTDVSFSSPFGQAPDLGRLSLTEADLQTLAKGLVTEGQRIVSRRWPCPSCGSSGARVGSASLLGNSQPYGRMYFDLDTILAPLGKTVQASSLEWDTVVAKLLQHFKMRVPVGLCDDCSLYYLDWGYDQDRIDAFYAGRATTDFSVDGVALSGRGHAPGFVFSKLAMPLYVESKIGGVSGKKIFDLGCAEGLMLEAFRQLGADVAGAEIDRSKVSYARKILGLAEISERTDALQRLAPGSVDVLVCHHTLEHLVRIEPWLDAMTAALRQGGYLVVSVPAVSLQPDGIAVEMGGDHWIGFTADTLRQHVEAKGLVVVDIRIDDGVAHLTDADPVFGLPNWSGRRIDTTVIARKTT